MLFVHVKEFRNRHIYFVLTPNQKRFLLLHFGSDTFRFLVHIQRVPDRKRNMGEVLFIGTVKKTFLVKFHLVDFGKLA